MEGSTKQTPWRTITLGPFGANPADYTFRVMTQPPTKSGRTKVFPTHQTIGPTDPDRDDTLTTLNFMDISGGIGVYNISPASDLNSYWWGIASAEGTDGWTMAREAIMDQPAAFTGDHVPLGRIGASTYGLWGTHIHQWDPDTQTWSNSVRDLGFPVVNTEGIAYFNEIMFFPLGDNGYAYAYESAPGTLAAAIIVTGVAHPTWVAQATPTTNPKAYIFAVWRDTLMCLTTKADGHYLVGSTTGLTGTWNWHEMSDDSKSQYVHIETGFEPHAMAAFPNAQNQYSLWLSGRRGLRIYAESEFSFAPTNFNNPPPHPDMGRAMQEFRPGEALWIAGGGGDAIQYTVSGAVVPASGPGGQKQGLGGNRVGLPGSRRGSIVSFATDLFHLYALVRGETAEGTSASIVEDTEGGDAIYVPGAVATSSLLAYNAKGWHPFWESATPGETPTKVVVSDGVTTTGGTDYRVFWGLGEEAWSMQCRLSTHSSRQAIQNATGERFRSTQLLGYATQYQESYIEWGRFDGGSIASHKLASHAAILMEHATATEKVEYQWYDEHGQSDAWETLGEATSDATSGEPRTVFPFGGVDINGTTVHDIDDMVWSKGEPFQWIRQRLRLISANASKPPIVTAMSLSYLPVPMDAATKSYTILLPAEKDEVTNMTAEQVVNKLEALFSPVDEEDLQFLFLQDGPRIYRAYIASISYGRAWTPEAMGSLMLTVIQIPTGVTGENVLLGER